MTAADQRCAMLSGLSACAYRLGLAFGEEAERAEDLARKLEYFRLFDRCFFAVRVATALELRLWRAPVAVSDEPRAADEELLDRPDPPEHERPEGREDADRDREGDRDRDRDREAEPASLPVLLRTLDGVVADAAALPGPEPAVLPTLRELLSHVTVERPAAASPKADLRARLAGSATAVTLDLPARPPGRSGGLAARRATGPPRR